MEKFMQRENVFFGHGRGASNSDNNMDFNDVFGGPPRRYSMQEVRTRYSFGEPVESELEMAKPAAWSGLKEKPVFGEETNPRRRHNQGDDFFDDIFKGGESYGSPRRSDRDRNDMFGLSPGSRIMSPLPPPSHDPIASHSIPPHLSLPAKLSKSVDLPTFGSQYSSTNGFNSPHSSSPLSRLSSRAIGSHEDDHRMGDEAHPSPLSRGSSFIFDEDFPSTDQKNSSDKLSKDMRNVDNIFNHFHFSIYKWAGRGVPMLMPLVGGNSLTSKGRMKYDKCASSNGRMERTLSGFKKQSEPEALTTIRQHMDDTSFVLYGVGESVVEEQVNKKMDESNAKKESSVKKTESFNSQMKTPLHAFLNKGDDDHQETEDEKPKIHDRKRDKEREGIGIDSNNGKVERDVAKSLGVSELNKSASKGKVKEFVQIFNQEPDGVQTNASSRRRNIGDGEKKAAKDKEQVNLHNVDNKPDASFKAVENPNNHEARQYSSRNTPSTDHSSTNQKTTFPPEMEHRFSVDSALEVNFMVEELFDTHETVSDNKSSNDTKAIDAKIRQWAVGKTGNIRSLLSTLQHVLWADSVPLVDLIEANAVKRAYQKALLRLHPDKLQQKGADFQHKYTAEKVFDILQEAWDHFNTCAMTV